MTLQSVENRAISEHFSYFEAVPRTFVQDCSPRTDVEKVEDGAIPMEIALGPRDENTRLASIYSH